MLQDDEPPIAESSEEEPLPETEEDQPEMIDDQQADEWRRIREELNRKKAEFEANLDPHLSDDEKQALIR